MAKKILVVEDETDIRDQLKVRLEFNGYDVITAENGEEALKKAREEKPDLMILDVMMPAPNGFQVARELKDDPELRAIYIIMLTAKATESDEFWGQESGADEYMTKPYSGEEFLEKVKNGLGE